MCVCLLKNLANAAAEKHNNSLYNSADLIFEPCHSGGETRRFHSVHTLEWILRSECMCWRLPQRHQRARCEFGREGNFHKRVARIISLSGAAAASACLMLADARNNSFSVCGRNTFSLISAIYHPRGLWQPPPPPPPLGANAADECIICSAAVLVITQEPELFARTLLHSSLFADAAVKRASYMCGRARLEPHCVHGRVLEIIAALRLLLSNELLLWEIRRR